MPDVDSSSRICRHELCELEGLHLFHKITPFHVRCVVCDVVAGELCKRVELVGVHERMCGPFHHRRILTVREIDPKPIKCARDPWTLPAPEALDESILRATSDRVPRILMQLAPIVENDFGRIAPTENSALKQLQRRIKKLCEAGQLLRVDLGKRLYAYLSPDARIAGDVDAIREQVMESFERTWYLRGRMQSARA